MELGIATGWKSLEGQDRKRPDCLETIGKKKEIVSGDSGEGQRRIIEKSSIFSGNAWTIMK